MNENIIINLTAQKILRFFLTIIFFLLVMNIIDIFYTHYLGHKTFINYKWIFDGEKNFPAYYSSLAILLASLLLFIIALTKKDARNTYYWFGLSAVFLYLSFDELFRIHERLSPLAKEFFPASNIIGWWVPIGIILLPLSLIYLRFVFNLPKRTRSLFIVSGLIFILGAVGFEILGSMALETNGRDITYAVLYTIEELLEMLGIVIFIYALVDYMSGYIKSFTITIK